MVHDNVLESKVWQTLFTFKKIFNIFLLDCRLPALEAEIYKGEGLLFSWGGGGLHPFHKFSSNIGDWDPVKLVKAIPTQIQFKQRWSKQLVRGILLRLLKPGIGLAHGWGNEIDKKSGYGKCNLEPLTHFSPLSFIITLAHPQKLF